MAKRVRCSWCAYRTRLDKAAAFNGKWYCDSDCISYILAADAKKKREKKVEK